jgi:hypothetical protein
MKKILAALFTITLLAGCAAPTPDAGAAQTADAAAVEAIVSTEIHVMGLTATVEAGYTPTPPPATPTPEALPEPAVQPALSEVNNTGVVLENNLWVAKNPEGAITATWNGTDWEYNQEAITVSRTVIGFEGYELAILDPALADLPADTPEKHFTDPASGQPLPYGYVREDRIQAVSLLGESYQIPISIFAVRLLGTVAVSTTNNAVVLELPLAADRSIIFIMDENVQVGVSLYSLPNDGLAEGTALVELPAALIPSASNWNLFNRDLRGQQVLMAVYHDVPDILSMAYAQWNINTQCAALLAYVNDPSAQPPAINAFDSFVLIPPVWNAALWAPSAIVDPLR